MRGGRGAEAEPAMTVGNFIGFEDDGRFGENVRALIRRVIVDANERRFSIETLTGEVFEYSEKGGECFFVLPEDVVPFPDKKSRSA